MPKKYPIDQAIKLYQEKLDRVPETVDQAIDRFISMFPDKRLVTKKYFFGWFSVRTVVPATLDDKWARLLAAKENPNYDDDLAHCVNAGIEATIQAAKMTTNAINYYLMTLKELKKYGVEFVELDDYKP